MSDELRAVSNAMGESAVWGPIFIRDDARKVLRSFWHHDKNMHIVREDNPPEPIRTWPKAPKRLLREALMAIVGVMFMLVLPAFADNPEAQKLSKLQPEFRVQVAELLGLARASWPERRIVLAEGYRSQAKQNILYSAGPSVTTVRQSKHTKGLAADIYFLSEEGLILRYDQAPYEQLGIIGESIGLRWGGRWKQPFDPGHFERNTK